ncbi:hypothetical protein D3C75_1333350 [compost metagenome]
MTAQVVLAAHLSFCLLYFFSCLFKAVAHFGANGQLTFYKSIGLTVIAVLVEIRAVVHIGTDVFPKAFLHRQ